MDLKTLDNIFEKGILGLVLAALLFSALATGAVRTLEFAIVQTLVATAGILWLVRIWVNPNHKRLLLPPVVWPMLLFLGYAAFHYMQADLCRLFSTTRKSSAYSTSRSTSLRAVYSTSACM